MHRIARFLPAAPDLLTAVTFLVAWIAPLAWGTGLVGNLLLTMLLEFLIVHSGAFIGMTVLAPDVSRLRKTLVVIGFGAFYMVFVLAIAFALKRLWPVWAFLWLLGGKLALVWFQRAGGTDEVQRQRELWIWSVLCYLGGTFVTLLLPLPRLGLTPEAIAQVGLTGKGLWVEKPQTVMAFGLLYFSALAWFKLRPAPVPAQA